MAAVTVIDGYNFLHYHPTTKQMMKFDQVDQARAMLHKLLAAYAEEQQQEFRVVYDATTVSASDNRRPAGFHGSINRIHSWTWRD
ncbi:hypothetical protein OEZ85_004289 [Tetradesmus obliquus]|uniref:NYN domain-containing protein n=1 Tax=Tetradesmus obliquus TaxID=3088 RepID=A0ABY8UK73_TETOB|nr:hypothetical protein OEZ85_004289 [Tetradesmus obliquus]